MLDIDGSPWINGHLADPGVLQDMAPRAGSAGQSYRIMVRSMQRYLVGDKEGWWQKDETKVRCGPCQREWSIHLGSFFAKTKVSSVCRFWLPSSLCSRTGFQFILWKPC